MTIIFTFPSTQVHLGVCEHKVVECSKCGGAKEDDHECPEGRECCPLALLGCEHKNAVGLHLCGYILLVLKNEFFLFCLFR